MAAVAAARPPKKAKYAAGVWPACTGKEDGKSYFLMGLQSSKTTARKWCCFWGWQDPEDESVFATAAREGTEEGLRCFGERAELEEALKNPDTRQLIFKNCFMIYLGELDKRQREYVVLKFAAHRWDPQLNAHLTTCEKEVARVAWFAGEGMLNACLTPKPGQTLSFPEMDEGHHCRTFLQSWIHSEETWKTNGLEEFCRTGRSPIKPYFKW